MPGMVWRVSCVVPHFSKKLIKTRLLCSSTPPTLWRLKSKVDERIAQGKLRGLTVINYASEVDFSSNDYLGLSRCKVVADNVRYEYETYLRQELGQPLSGSTGSRLLTGNSSLHEDTEIFLAQFHNQKYALVANSGWDLNFGVCSSIPCATSLVLFDELVHNSIIMGIRSGRQKLVESFIHNKVDDIINIFKKNPDVEDKLIIVESIYSMDGDQCPISDVLAIAKEHNAMVLVDEAHSVGVYGKRGEGLLCSLGLQNHPNLLGIIYTFGKAVGAHGAVITTNHEGVVEYLLNYCRPLVYSTSLPAHSMITIRACYERMEKSIESRIKLFQNILLFKKISADVNLPLLSSDSMIQSVMIPTNDAVVAVAKVLREKGFACLPIRAPTVPIGSERIRIIIHAQNTENEIRDLCNCLCSAIWKFNIKH